MRISAAPSPCESFHNVNQISKGGYKNFEKTFLTPRGKTFLKIFLSSASRLLKFCFRCKASVITEAPAALRSFFFGGARLLFISLRHRERNPMRHGLKVLKFSDSDRERLNIPGVEKPNKFYMQGRMKMILRYQDRENKFIFEANSIDSAFNFILKLNSGLSENSNDGSDWVGNHISILSTDNNYLAYRPLFKAED